MTTAPGGLSAVTLRPQQAVGCTAADYGSVNVRGAFAIVDDKGCSVVDKQNAAVGRGAVGVLVVSDPGAERQSGRACSRPGTTSSSRRRSP